MKTNRLFTGDIYNGDVCVKKNAVLVYFLGKGYIPFSNISGDFEVSLIDKGRVSSMFLGLEPSSHTYVSRESIRPFEFDYVQALREMDVKSLRRVVSNYSK